MAARPPRPKLSLLAIALTAAALAPSAALADGVRRARATAGVRRAAAGAARERARALRGRRPGGSGGGGVGRGPRAGARSGVALARLRRRAARLRRAGDRAGWEHRLPVGRRAGAGGRRLARRARRLGRRAGPVRAQRLRAHDGRPQRRRGAGELTTRDLAASASGADAELTTSASGPSRLCTHDGSAVVDAGASSRTLAAGQCLAAQGGGVASFAARPAIRRSGLEAPGFCSFEVALDDSLSPGDVAAPPLDVFPGGDPAGDVPRDPCDKPGASCDPRSGRTAAAASTIPTPCPAAARRASTAAVAVAAAATTSTIPTRCRASAGGKGGKGKGRD